jgi:kynurenine formamidase
MSRVSLATAGVLVLSTGVAWAECSPETWQDCAGKPWVEGDKMETPLGSQWWPHPIWGEGDEGGSTNWYAKPEVVLRALAEADQGKTYKLGHPYTADMPLFGARKFVLRIPAAPTGGPLGANNIVWNDEFLATEVGQVGTQFDGLGHIGVAIDPTDKAEMRFYNGFSIAEMSDPYGLKKLGAEKLTPIVARGVLLDFAAARGVENLGKGECASMDDVKAALEKQGMADFQFMEGDALMFRYGWERFWSDPAAYNDGSPGICLDTVRWVAEEVRAGVTGGDTWNTTDPVPYPGEEGCVFCVHQVLQTRHGIVNQENLMLKQLADDGVYVFTYIYSPAPVAGATGSMGSPIAID